MKGRPHQIPEDVWQEAVRAGFHATPEASLREVEEILCAALPVLGLFPDGPAQGLIPAQTGHLGEAARTARDPSAHGAATPRS